MRIIALPEPPNPADSSFSRDPKAYNLAMYRWMTTLKSQLTTDARVANRSVGQNFVVTNFSTATTLTGTDSTTHVAQFLCTLVQALVSKGILKPNKTNQ